VIWDCNGQDDQTWDFGSDGTIRNVHAGLCLDVYNAGTGNGTPLVLWSCDGGDNRSGPGPDPRRPYAAADTTSRPAAASTAHPSSRHASRRCRSAR
jgi:hypothetical protein